VNRLIDRVEQLLRYGYKTATPQTLRDNDRALLLACWEQNGLYLNDEQKVAFMNATAAESITRARRALKDRYPASPEITEKRYKRFNEYKYENAVML
jgi:hypothetical protein